MTFLITGAAGFIGSHFTELCLSQGHRVIAYDKLTYAGYIDNVPPEAPFIYGDICNGSQLKFMLSRLKPDAVFNFAAESHVCRSIDDAESFVHSNITGTYVLLREALAYWRSRGEPKEFRYVQISTDEVFGDLGPDDEPFTEESHRRPHSPYAASKCAADHLVSSFVHTYGLPCLVTHCSNNYGPRQYPEKLIPLAVSCFLRGEFFGLHGDGSNVRDWISVEDHCAGVLAAWERGVPGESYCFGGAAERSNLEVLRIIADTLGTGTWHSGPDRPGNDRRYAINFSKATKELGWSPKTNFEEGLSRTVSWYCDNRGWIDSALRSS